MNLPESQLEFAALSDRGYVREENQDRMGDAAVPLGRLFVVADGMGGHKGGAFAAKIVVQGLCRYLEAVPADAAVEEAVQGAFAEVNGTVFSQGHGGDPAIEGMGSTAVLLLVAGRTARVAHVGDSRAYLYHGGRLRQLTTDHTMVQRMVEAGMLRPEEAATHPDSSVLDRALGAGEEVEPDISGEIMLDDGDGILLCSDGLSGYLEASEIEAVLQSEATVGEVPELLVQLALEKGGADNVTVQFIQYGRRRESEQRSPNGSRGAAAAGGEQPAPLDAPAAPLKEQSAAAAFGKEGDAPFPAQPGRSKTRLVRVVILILLVAVAAGALYSYWLAAKGDAGKPPGATGEPGPEEKAPPEAGRAQQPKRGGAPK